MSASRPSDPGWRRFAEVDRLFDAALEQPEVEREQFLAQRSAEDPDLPEAVRALLEAERDSVGLFEGGEDGAHTYPDATTAREALYELAGDARA